MRKLSHIVVSSESRAYWYQAIHELMMVRIALSFAFDNKSKRCFPVDGQPPFVGGDATEFTSVDNDDNTLCANSNATAKHKDLNHEEKETAFRKRTVHRAKILKQDKN